MGHVLLNLHITSQLDQGAAVLCTEMDLLFTPRVGERLDVSSRLGPAEVRRVAPGESFRTVEVAASSSSSLAETVNYLVACGWKRVGSL